MTKSNIATKHDVFRTKIYASPENFTHPPDVMDVTFKRSTSVCVQHSCFAKFTPAFWNILQNNKYATVKATLSNFFAEPGEHVTGL